VQNKRSESWTLEEVDDKLETAMKRVYRAVDTFSRHKKVDRRIAAYALALQRIEAVYKEREIFP
jgi:glutamate dehydrogenase (NAD(P)+)